MMPVIRARRDATPNAQRREQGCDARRLDCDERRIGTERGKPALTGDFEGPLSSGPLRPAPTEHREEMQHHESRCTLTVSQSFLHDVRSLSSC